MKQFFIGASMFAMLSLGSSAFAQDEPGGIKIGTLSCHEQSGWGFLFGSSRKVRCLYTGVNGSGRYDGRISKFGVDVGYQGPSDLVWAVFAPTDRLGPGALDGQYAGLTAGAAAGVGLGANALVGGSDRSMVLQPLSVEATTGLEADAGVGTLTLDNVPGSYEPA